MLKGTDNVSYLACSRDAPDIRALPPDVTLSAVEMAIPLLQELFQENIDTDVVENCKRDTHPLNDNPRAVRDLGETHLKV